MPLRFPASIDEIAGIFSLTGDSIGNQLSPGLLVFLLHHRDGLSFTDIMGGPFCDQSKEFQAEYIRITMIHQLVKRQVVAEIQFPTGVDDDQ